MHGVDNSAYERNSALFLSSPEARPLLSASLSSGYAAPSAPPTVKPGGASMLTGGSNDFSQLININACSRWVTETRLISRARVRWEHSRIFVIGNTRGGGERE